jgi:predicted DNA binding CopG/RHH family protein
MKKQLPALTTDAEAESFVANANLSDYNLSPLRPVRFEFQPKDERINMRLPAPLLAAIKQTAARAGIPYQRFIRHALEAAIQIPMAK